MITPHQIKRTIRNNWIILPFILMILAMGCEDEEITWNTEDVPAMLVVEGSLTNEHKVHRITLSRSADYFSNQPTPRISGADVTITGGKDTIRFEENPQQKGVYLTQDKVAGKPGITYQLDIHLDDPVNDQSHYYAHETMIRGIDLDTIDAALYNNPLYAENSPMDSLILYVIAYGEEPLEYKNYYSVNLYRNGQALKDTIDETEIYSDTEELDGAYVNYLFFFETFQPGDTLGLEIASVSKQFRNYLTGIKNIVNQSGNPFDLSGPPANAIGNIQGAEALGYFRVSYVSKTQTVVRDQRDVKAPI